ncbi:MAG: Smr/MutS family protein [Desulfarculaceae bacterium]|jgi:DNA-nicking Smr family endonuclease
MAHKKKSRKNQGPGRGADSRQSPFNNPFVAMKKDLKTTASPVAPEQTAPEEKPQPEPDDQTAFEAAMKGVTPLDSKVRARQAKRPGHGRPRLEMQPDDDLEVMAQLADLISGGGDFDLRLTGQFVQGAAPGVGAELMNRLSQGAFPVQDYLDLHGMNEQEALSEVERFLAAAATRGLRHVLLVHGKGRRSAEGVPILKTALAKTLSHKRFMKRVLAFCTATPVDGGAGAMYVLLRKWSGPPGGWPPA